tara:strand:- start:1049 stop:1360 length:312 start_codon:yes stop_codon:yes gene_type:complete
MVKVGDDVSFKIGDKVVEGEVVGHEGKMHRVKITKRPKGIPVGMKVAIMSTSALNVDPILGAMPSKSKKSTKGKVPKGSHRMPDGSIMRDDDPRMKGKKTYKK